MNWWESTDVLSKAGTWISALLIVLGVLGLSVKVQLDRLKSAKDRIALVERQKREGAWQQELDEAKRKTRAVEQKTKPRTVTPEQRSRLINSLHAGPKGPVVILSDWMDMETKAYAATLESILQESGFQIIHIRPGVLTMGWNGDPDDRPAVILFVTDIDHPLPHAYSIQKTFLDNEISTTAMRASEDIERGHLRDESQAEWKLDSNTTVLWVMNRM
jgi:hypothetical protein